MEENHVGRDTTKKDLVRGIVGFPVESDYDVGTEDVPEDKVE